MAALPPPARLWRRRGTTSLKLRTKVIKKNTNPEWSEELTLSIEDPAQLHILSGCFFTAHSPQQLLPQPQPTKQILRRYHTSPRRGIAARERFAPSPEGGWKGWGEISYGGHQCLKRAQAAEYLVRSWMGERYPDIDEIIVSYIMGYDSLKDIGSDKDSYSSKQVIDARLRMDGLFELEEHAVQFVEEFIALYTNGPAGGGGISTGQRKELILQKMLVDRENIFWRAHANKASIPCLQNQAADSETFQMHVLKSQKNPTSRAMDSQHIGTSMGTQPSPVRASSGKKIALYHIAHSRVGDKGNDINFSIIPHFPGDIGRLRAVITPDWVKNVVSPLLDLSSFPDERAIQRRINLLEHVSVEIYDVPGISSMNVVALFSRRRLGDA